MRTLVEKARASALPGMVKDLEAVAARAQGRITGARQRAQLPLEKIREKAAVGMWRPSSIARVLGWPKSTFLDPLHRESVLEAIEDGKARFEANAYERYQRAIQGGKLDKAVFALLIFQMKQIGWTDKQQVVTPGTSPQDATGARERLRGLIERARAQAGAKA